MSFRSGSFRSNRHSLGLLATRSNGQYCNSAYAGTNAGLNLGAWYFRHDGNYNRQEKGGSQYQSLNNYVQRDIPAIV
ncbi:TPA: fimbria/pilus outer membrane usher protein [Salmonella enterica subsp. enterica serovar Grumpensis]